jgi:dihydrodipicolinate synthase/N-acetylneuraminate lyase
MNASYSVSGVIVPMVSPFTEQGTIDVPAVFRLTEKLVSHGASPFVLGTTGESASISSSQKIVMIKAMIEANAERSMTYAGISSNSYESSVTLAKRFFDEGIDIFVAHPPCYYPLTDAQIISYYEKLAGDIPGPLVLYNIPAVTHCSISLAAIDELSQHQNIIAIKDSERDINRLVTILAKYNKDPNFVHLIGWGAQMSFSLKNGSGGMVPSSGNLVPGLFVDMFQAAKEKDYKKTENLQNLADQVSRIYQEKRKLGESLAALKIMLSEMNLCKPHVLPPLVRLSPADEDSIVREMQDCSIFSEMSLEK